MKIGHEDLKGQIEVELQDSVDKAERMLQRQRDYKAKLLSADLTKASPEQRENLAALSADIDQQADRVELAKQQIQSALKDVDRETARNAIQEAMRYLDAKLDPRHIVGLGVEFNIPDYLDELRGRRMRHMLSAVETTALACGHSKALLTRRQQLEQELAEKKIAIAEYDRQIAELQAAGEQEKEDLIMRHSQPMPSVMIGKGARLVAPGGSAFGALAGQRRVVSAHVSSDVPTWFNEAIESVREATDGKISCSLIKADFDLMWARVYQRESKFENAKQAAQRHVDEVEKYLPRWMLSRASLPLKRALDDGLCDARERFQAIASDIEVEGDSERRRQAAVMITATELNIECTAISFAELNKINGRSKYPPISTPGDDVAHGFGPRPVTNDQSSIYQRYHHRMGKGASNSQWCYCIWRMALEMCAYPNVSDTITAMEFASIAAAKSMLNPPDGSPANAEVRLMQVAYWAAMLCEAANKESREVYADGPLLDAYAWLARFGEVHAPRIVFDAVERVAPHLEGVWTNEETAWEGRRVEFRGLLRYWSCTWRESGYARIDVGHKLAAALMLTDVGKEIEVRSPWKAFSLHVPPGITRVSRVLVMAGDQDAEKEDDHKIATLGVIFEDGSFGEFTENHLQQSELDLLSNLVRGVCLAAEQGHAERAGNHGSTGSKGGSKRIVGKPPAGERYQLAAPVRIDLRDVVREHLDGKRRGGSPKVQFIVRGHWRDQACGPQRSMRKRIWIEPFWKGPEESRVLLRAHQVEGDKLKEAP